MHKGHRRANNPPPADSLRKDVYWAFGGKIGFGEAARPHGDHVECGGRLPTRSEERVNRIMSGPTQPKRAESLAERPVRPWTERLAHAIPFFVLPSGVWRLAVAFGFPMGMLNDAGKLAIVRGWPAIYVAAISLLSEAVALTAFGLVRPWGEVTPTWLPLIGGRQVRPRIAIITATVGSVALMLIWTLGFWDVWTGEQAHTMSSPFWAAVFAICYAPLNLWGPALLVLTWAYHRRRAARVSDEVRM